jgi:hypothetical protein
MLMAHSHDASQSLISLSCRLTQPRSQSLSRLPQGHSPARQSSLSLLTASDASHSHSLLSRSLAASLSQLSTRCRSPASAPLSALHSLSHPDLDHPVIGMYLCISHVSLSLLLKLLVCKIRASLLLKDN